MLVIIKVFANVFAKIYTRQEQICAAANRNLLLLHKFELFLKNFRENGKNKMIFANFAFMRKVKKAFQYWLNNKRYFYNRGRVPNKYISFIKHIP